MTDDELKRLIESASAETRGHFEVLEEKVQAIVDSDVETRRHFDVVGKRLEKKIELVVEAVVSLTDEMRRENSTLREDMDRGFEDTRAMIGFSYAELDQRLRAL